MSIKTPREDMEKQSNNTFQMEMVSSTMSYDISQGMGEQEIGMNFESAIGPSFYTDGLFETTFKNPSNERPMRASEFLKILDLSQVIEVAKEKYGNKHWHYRYPVEAMIKAQVFRYIKGIKSDSALVRHLNQYPDDAKQLGFIEKD